MNINFFWKGDDFQFLNRLTLLSHVLVDHEVVLWLEGNTPKSKYWISDITEIEIRDAKEIHDISDLSKDKVDVRTSSDRWSFHLVNQTGEYYADTDAIAIKPWPNQDIVLATYDKRVVNVGVIKLPKKHPILACAIKEHKQSWGNVWIFTSCVRRNGLDYNVPIEMFYPIHCGYNQSKVFKCNGAILDELKLPDNCVSYHYWSNKTSNVGIDHTWLDNPKAKGSLFWILAKKIFKHYPQTIKHGRR